MKLPLYWVDAFTNRVFSGNPAGVVPLDRWLPDAVMQQIAFEHGLAETAFFVRTGPDRFHLRWFTPGLEVDLCGHATLATAFTLFTQLQQPGDAITFDSRSGPLVVTRRGDTFELDFPARTAARIEPSQVPAALRNALGGATPEAWRKVTTHAHYLALFRTEDEVRGLRPDFAAIATLGDARLLATAPGGDCDFVSRYFAPGAGVPEDPVTGSAHCTLVPYWAERLGRSSLYARQVSARGGELWCENVPAPSGGAAAGRVRIAGRAVLYLRGDISIEL
jgi:PhzF family phenazine biosynthesis protein